jgi:hypothetical protein
MKRHGIDKKSWEKYLELLKISKSSYFTEQDIYFPNRLELVIYNIVNRFK